MLAERVWSVFSERPTTNPSLQVRPCFRPLWGLTAAERAIRGLSGVPGGAVGGLPVAVRGGSGFSPVNWQCPRCPVLAPRAPALRRFPGAVRAARFSG